MITRRRLVRPGTRHTASLAQRKQWGAEAEARFFTICTSPLAQTLFPPWLKYVVYATKSEDKKGVDAWVVTTDTAPIPLNVKRSLQALNSKRRKLRRTGRWYRENRGVIIPIIVSPMIEDRKILNQMLDKVTKRHTQLLKGLRVAK